MLGNNDTWRQQYRSDRYMEFVEETAFLQRITDVNRNSLTFNPKGQVSFTNSELWLECQTHIFEELKLRGLEYRIPRVTAAMKAGFPDPRSPRVEQAVRALQLIPSHLIGAKLVKYGSAAHMRRALYEGIFRLAPASYYSDPSLNAAVQDDELHIYNDYRADQVSAMHICSATGAETRLDLRGQVHVVHSALSDYSILCLGSSLSVRMFEDFEAEACLVIKDNAEFSRRLTCATAVPLSGCTAHIAGVGYVDPLRTKTRPTVFFEKHFRYSYQEEVRFAWIPKIPVEKVEPVMVCLGSLADIAELVLL